MCSASWTPGGRNSCSTAFRADRCSSPAAKTTGWERCSKERCFTLQTARLCDGKGVAAKCMFPLGRARWCAAVISWAYLIWTTPPGPTQKPGCMRAGRTCHRRGRRFAQGSFIVLRAEQIRPPEKTGARLPRCCLSDAAFCADAGETGSERTNLSVLRRAGALQGERFFSCPPLWGKRKNGRRKKFFSKTYRTRSLEEVVF